MSDSRAGARKSFIVVQGPSMSPTLRAGDLLQLAPPDPTRIRPGDVVVFRLSPRAEAIVHRVTECASHGFRTRGDNNAAVDLALVPPESLIGVVVQARRKERALAVRGGVRGRIAHRIARLLNGYWRFRNALVQVACLRVPAVRTLLRAAVRWRGLQQLVLGGQQGTALLLLGHRVIGRRSSNGAWEIRPPFCWFVEPPSGGAQT